MPKHALERMAERAESLQTDIKKKYSENKALARQIIAGARENADYSCDDERWSMSWYAKFIKELEERA
jgi:hypothetical protein